VAGHEITHLTPENINQQIENKTKGTNHDIELKPEIIERKILDETGLRNLKSLNPIKIDFEKLKLQ
jgi:hypothetical protein